MTWMQRLKRVFAIEIETCQRCGGKLEVMRNGMDAPVLSWHHECAKVEVLSNHSNLKQERPK
jgi:hypothetical protein